jgi:integrin beta 3
VPGAQGEKGLDGKDGRDGLHGKDGVDGLGFDDIQVEHDGERGFTFKFVRGDRVKTFGSFTVPATIHRGLFVAGKKYERGDQVTWGGSMWTAMDTTSATPGEKAEASRAWALTAQRGRDGKPGPAGPQGERGAKGDAGPQGRSGY